VSVKCERIRLGGGSKLNELFIKCNYMECGT